ncbi:MAG: UDP-N-acetylmuramyl-tripeptide synthetase, partial [Candidatus Dormiibacterota bacterium]
STVTHLTAHVLQRAGIPTGFVSTVAEDVGRGVEGNASGLTTAGAPALQAALATMVAEGRRAAVLEASSHALDQDRVAACEFDVAAFTQVGHDHLDYHGTWARYLAAKAKLVELCREGAAKGVPKTAVLNRDDRSYARLAEHPIERRFAYTLGEEAADLRASEVQREIAATSFRLHAAGASVPVRLPMPGLFNVANALCSAGICLAFGVPPETIALALGDFPGVPGRLERVDRGQPFAVYVDYAHAAESLASALAELRAVTKGRLLAVFGCSDRSDGHDPEGMGRSAARGADWFCITTDDPVDTDPAELARRVADGARSTGRGSWEVELDRARAIELAIEHAGPDDTVLLAGKGHERFMMVAGRRREPWDERGAAAAALHRRGWG